MQKKSASPITTLDKIVSLAKRRGFAYPSSEIYGGLNGIYDSGPLGTLLTQNIKKAWVDSLKLTELEILFMEGSLLGSKEMWEASGHLQNFHDPMVDCMVCKHRFRADEIDLTKACSHCGNKQWTEVRQFNMMFATNLGATADQATTVYLRPETAQAIFINFKNIISTNRVKIPFGVAQIGKAFRNEITPKQFLFRVREFEQMEIEWFCKKEDALAFFGSWRTWRKEFFTRIGINEEHIRLRDYEKEELAHYSTATTDIEYLFPFGWKELEGIAYRGDFDLRQHSNFSGKDLSVFDETTQSSYLPHVVECSVGVGRLFLALLCDAYDEEVIEEETRIVLRFHPSIAPIKAAFMPLTKKQHDACYALYKKIKKETGFEIQYDDSGSIGKRYRRQDEIGTPFCFTYDFESVDQQTITVRMRDSMEQQRIPIDQLVTFLTSRVLVS